MRGHIKQRAKGTWSLVIDAGRDPATGKRRQQWHTIKGTKKEAEAKLRELLQTVEAGTYVKPGKLTLGQWLEEWLKSYIAINVSKRTAVSYGEQIMQHIIPALGAVYLSDLQPQHLQNYYAKALTSGRIRGQGGLSKQTVLYQHRIMSQALNDAVRHGVTARNIAAVVQPPRPKRKTMATIPHEDVTRFLEAAKDTPFYEVFFTALYTGMRRGELLALRWCDVDLDLASLSVVQSLYRLTGGEFVIKEPKSPQSRRSIAMPPTLALLLRKYKEERIGAGIMVGKPLGDNDLVFCHFDGTPFDPSTVTHTFSKTTRKIGLSGVRFHDLRHSHATLMLKAGVHPKIVSERLGHARVGITLDTYSHVLPGLQEAAAESFDKMLKPREDDERSVSKPLAKP